MALFVIFFIWIRATLPWLRYDQPMSFGWKALLPPRQRGSLVTADHRRHPTSLQPLPRTTSSRSSAIPRRGRSPALIEAFGATLKGMRTTFARIIEVHIDRVPGAEDAVYRASAAGRHRLDLFEDTGLEKCVDACCASCCLPLLDCIRVVAAEKHAAEPYSAGQRYAAVTRSTSPRCIFCGDREVACRFDAITMGQDDEMLNYTRSDLNSTKEMLLAEPLERTPLRRAVGRVSAACSSSRRSA